MLAMLMEYGTMKALLKIAELFVDWANGRFSYLHQCHVKETLSSKGSCGSELHHLKQLPIICAFSPMVLPA